MSSTTLKIYLDNSSCHAVSLCRHEPPFDRHDWIVDRDGKEVRYVIDFYAHDPGNGLPPTTVIDARYAEVWSFDVIDWAPQRLLLCSVICLCNR
jgi:hypothetical protein